ncbi:MAG: mechanosensitive ion channel family protein [Bacilli bacterium]|nr:mechanosensitive ion channel family protein [Bacilli bacterium]
MTETINNIVENKLVINVFHSIIIILISLIIYNSISYLLKKNTKIDMLNTKKSQTSIKMIKSIIKYSLIIITTLIVLQVNGINVSSMLAGVGIIGIVIGFAIQDALKDIIKGMDIIMDNYYRVGDVIKFNNIEGKVLTIGLKTTKVEDMYTMNIVSISNRNIDQVEVVSNLINIDIPLPYELALSKAEKVLDEIVDNIKERKVVDKCEYRGVNHFADSSIKYQVKVYCNPLKKVQTRRDAQRCILDTLEKNKISIPYNQIDVHQK